MATELGYFTLAVPDTEKGTRFFGALFDWKFEDVPEGNSKAYRHVANTQLPCGLVDRDDAMPLRPYFRVDDIRAAVARVRSLGGTSNDPSLSESGWSCLAHDDQGVPFGLWQPAPGL